MPRPLNYDMLHELAEAIRQQPGGRPAHYARLLGVDNKSVQRWLAVLDDIGVLLAQDGRGRLHWMDSLYGQGGD